VSKCSSDLKDFDVFRLGTISDSDLSLMEKEISTALSKTEGANICNQFLEELKKKL
jgi:hypothetical protein